MSLFDLLEENTVTPSNYRPDALPLLDGIRDIELDCETTGLRWWEKDRPVGIALRLPANSDLPGIARQFPDGSRALELPPARCLYLPWGHRGGGNLDEDTVKRWAQTELRGKRITNLNTRFDVHMMRAWGVDLEAQGCEFSDVGHYAALLDDHRKSFSLENIGQDYLQEGKVEGLDKARISQYPAWRVADYAKQDVSLVGKLKAVMWPLLDEQDLQRVRALEDAVIPVVCEMEKNGALINLELLDKWIASSEREASNCLLEIFKQTGLNVNPGSAKDKTRLFKQLGLDLSHTSGGTVSFTDLVLKSIDHPIIALLRRAIKLQSLRSKYLLKYRQALDSNNILRYALHQLRATKDQRDESGEAGTVSGRFSSSEITEGVGVNIQQIFKASKQRVAFGYTEDDDSHDEEIYIIRELHRPGSGLHLCADAMQIEYRLFAGYAKSPRVLEAYKKDPYMSFHKMVWHMLQAFKPDLTYRRTKDCNFAKIYGAGLVKLAAMLEFISAEEAEKLKSTRAFNDPSLKQTKEINNLYNREMPEVPTLLTKAKSLAEERGFVRTHLGRRMRFPEKKRTHKAFNGIVQGGAADIMKQKLIELHANRKETGFLLRYTVHDEVDGDIPDVESARKVETLLNQQSFDLPVPILWEVEAGPTWARVAKL